MASKNKKTASQTAQPTEGKGIRYTTVAARILLGLVFFVFGLAYFFMSDTPVDTSTPGGQYMAALLATGFFLPVLKIAETIAGFMLFFKRWTPLALLILAPIVLQIFLYMVFLDPTAIIMGIVLVALLAFLAWRNWDKYKGLFTA